MNVSTLSKHSFPIVIDRNMKKLLISKVVTESMLQALLGIDNDVDVSLRSFRYEQVGTSSVMVLWGIREANNECTSYNNRKK